MTVAETETESVTESETGAESESESVTASASEPASAIVRSATCSNSTGCAFGAQWVPPHHPHAIFYPQVTSPLCDVFVGVRLMGLMVCGDPARFARTPPASD